MGVEQHAAKHDGQEQRVRPVPMPRVVLCPFCGGVSPNLEQCPTCKGRFDPLSRQASQNAMGPWSIRNDDQPFVPGCSYETIRALIARGRIGATTIVRGPTTNQFWTLAKRAPSIANLLGTCHNCQAEVDPGDFACGSCGAPFTPEGDRQHLGLAPTRSIPGQAPPAVIAALSGPPLGVEPIEVTRPGIIEEVPPAEARASAPPQGDARDDTRLWLALGVAVVVVIILGAVFGPDIARSLSRDAGPADRGGAGMGGMGGIGDGDRSPAGIGKQDRTKKEQNDVQSTGSGDEPDGVSDGDSPGAMGKTGDQSRADATILLKRVDVLMREDSPESLATALDMLRTEEASGVLSAQVRGELLAVIERRVVLASLRRFP